MGFGSQFFGGANFGLWEASFTFWEAIWALEATLGLEATFRLCGPILSFGSHFWQDTHTLGACLGVSGPFLGLFWGWPLGAILGLPGPIFEFFYVFWTLFWAFGEVGPIWGQILGWNKFWVLGFGLPGPGRPQRFKQIEHLASRFGLIGLNSVCQLFRQIPWKIQNDTTYNFYLFCLEGLGFRV